MGDDSASPAWSVALPRASRQASAVMAARRLVVRDLIMLLLFIYFQLMSECRVSVEEYVGSCLSGVEGRHSTRRRLVVGGAVVDRWDDKSGQEREER